MRKSQQSALRRLAVSTLVTLASAVTAVTAQAAYIATATEIGDDVVFNGSGTLNVAGMGIFIESVNSTGLVDPDTFVTVGPSAAVPATYYSPFNFSGPSTIGPGESLFIPGSGSGDISGVGFTPPERPLIFVPVGYISGATLSGTMTFADQTFSSMGLTPGTSVWAWESPGQAADSFTLNVGAVPVPAAVWLFGSGLLGLIGVARRKARA